MSIHRFLSLFGVALALLPVALGSPALAIFGAHAATGPQSTGQGRVVVLGFDGADWRTTERMMAAGELPNLAALAEKGTAGPLVSTTPAESAAGWAAINTGANPARNGVPSFVKRVIPDQNPFPGWGTSKSSRRPSRSSPPAGCSGSIRSTDRRSSGSWRAWRSSSASCFS